MIYTSHTTHKYVGIRNYKKTTVNVMLIDNYFKFTTMIESTLTRNIDFINKNMLGTIKTLLSILKQTFICRYKT